MAGAIVMVVLLVLVIPVMFLIGGAVVAAILGSMLKANGERTHEGSEFIDLNN
jgi:hypothetical protein